MEQDYWNKMKDMRDDASKYFQNMGNGERDMINQSKNYAMRLRLNRDIEFTDDFRKKYMTREYGNYEKYEKNSIEEENERGENDDGSDRLLRNDREMMMRIKTDDSFIEKNEKKEAFEDLLTNDTYTD
jgi:hypothetical protein